MKNKFSGLLKIAKKDDDKNFIDRHPISSSILAPTVGTRLITDPRNISKLTGTEHLYHGTPTKNVESILENGLLKSYSHRNDTVSAAHGMKSLAEGYVFLGRTKRAPKFMDLFHKRMGNKTNLLKIRIPFDELTSLGVHMDPSHFRSVQKNRKDKLLLFLLNNLSPFSPKHTIAVSGDIKPSYIAGSKHFNRGILKELTGMFPYAAKHPLRFLEGAGKVVGGLALTSIPVYTIAKSIKNRKNAKD